MNRNVLPLVLLIAFYGALLLFSFQEADEDVWGRMAAGRLAATLGHVPQSDVFAYVPTKSQWVDHEWLSGRVFYEVYRLWGGPGLLLLRALLGVSTVVCVYFAARAGGAARWAAIFLLLSISIFIIQGYNSVIRAQAFTFPFFAFFFHLLERARRGAHRPLLLLIPASALWANLHGGFVTGVLLLLGYGVGAALHQQWKRSAVLGALGGACFLASLLNPYGMSYWSYLTDALWMPRPEIIEWRGFELEGFGDLHIKAALFIVVLTWLIGKKHRIDSAVLLIGAVVAAVLHVRFAPFLGITLAVLLPQGLESAFEKAGSVFPRRLKPSLGPLALMVLLQLLLAMGLAVTWPQRSFSLEMKVPPDRYPVQAVQSLKDSSEAGNLAVFFNWGEYALYHLYPSYRVSVDGRYETVYPNEVVAANWNFTRGVEGAERLLEDYRADFALYPQSSGAAKWLSSAPGWQSMYQDALAVLYRRVP